jgi:hypothetical protein
MKKIFKIIYINILVVFAVCVVAEIVLFFADYHRICTDKYFKEEYLFRTHLRNYLVQFNHPIYFWRRNFRDPAGLEYKDKPSIILLGCSYAYGFRLEEKDSFHTLLANAMKRPVFNLALVAGGPRDTLYVMRDNELLSDLLAENNHNKTEYVIYTYMGNHKPRLLADLYKKSPKFEVINDGHNLRNIKPPLYENFYLYQKISKYVAEKTYKNPATDALFILYMKEIKDQVSALLNNEGKPVKFIFFVYEDCSDDWSELERYGIKVIKLYDILDENIKNVKYQLGPKDCHPNERAWQIVVPALVKELEKEKASE